MNEMPAIFGLAAGAARHAANRQAVIATNVANADTPGFRARDMAPFSVDDGFAPRRTRPDHMSGPGTAARSYEMRDVAADPNGNSVDLEDQVMRGLEAARMHDRALTVYRSSLDLMRAALGRR